MKCCKQMQVKENYKNKKINREKEVGRENGRKGKNGNWSKEKGWSKLVLKNLKNEERKRIKKDEAEKGRIKWKKKERYGNYTRRNRNNDGKWIPWKMMQNKKEMQK